MLQYFDITDAHVRVCIGAVLDVKMDLQFSFFPLEDLLKVLGLLMALVSSCLEP